MRQSICALRVALATLIAALLTFCVPEQHASAESAAASKAEVADSGWAVSAPEAAEEQDASTKDGKSPVFVKPKPGVEKQAKGKATVSSKAASAKPAAKEPRVAALPQSPRSLQWIPAGVVTKKQDAKSEAIGPAEAPSAKTSESAEEPPAAPVETPEEEPSTKDEPEEETTDEAPSASADQKNEPNEPAPFPEVIEIEDVPQKEAAADPKPRVEEPAPHAEVTPAPQVDPKPLKPLTRYQRSLRTRLRSVLSFYYRRPLNSIDHDPWEVMHNMLAYGQHSRILDGSRRGKPMTAVGYLCYNMPCQQKQMMSLTADGVIETRVAVGMQGHKGQLLAMLAQCGVSAEYPMRVDGAELTINDLIKSEQLSCYRGEELTFKLIGLMHYLEPDATWVNDQGETWNFPKLIYEERNQKIRGAPCGGTHRLSGLALAVRKREASGQPIDGEYLAAERFVSQYVNYAYRWQNQDGSLSTEWFRGPGAEEDINRRARTTGHLLEWLLYTIPDERLTERETVRAVSYLTSLLASNTNNPWEIGPLSHALHALMLYDERVFQPHDAQLIAAAEKSGRKSNSPANLNYRNIDSRVVRSLMSADDAEAARAEIANANSGFRGLFNRSKRPSSRARSR